MSSGSASANRNVAIQPKGAISTKASNPLAAEVEAEEQRDRALRLLAVGVGDHTPVEVQEQVAETARRLAELEPPVHEWT